MFLRLTIKLNFEESVHDFHSHQFALGNLAFGKPTTQSTRDHDGESFRAVDGKTDGDYHWGFSCSHTRSNLKNPWFRLDLKETISVGQVRIAW